MSDHSEWAAQALTNAARISPEQDVHEAMRAWVQIRDDATADGNDDDADTFNDVACALRDVLDERRRTGAWMEDAAAEAFVRPIGPPERPGV